MKAIDQNFHAVPVCYSTSYETNFPFFFLNFKFSYLGTKIVEFYILPFTNLSHRKLSF